MEENEGSSFQYPPELDFMVDGLKTISSQEDQLEYWTNCGYYESSLTFDEEIDYFRHVVRAGKTNLTKQQVKSILRVHVMCNRFDRIVDGESVPEKFNEKNLYMINHPYWVKIRKQAQLALSLIKIK